MSLIELPLLRRLHGSRGVLIAGAGGGFDIFAGLPLVFALRRAGIRVELANLTFSNLGGTDATSMAPALARIDEHVQGSDEYFPERYLAEFLAARGEPSTVYALEKVGVVPLRAAYQVLVERLDVDAIVLVDGGSDILMRGDEAGLGTPAEDMVSLAAVAGIEVPVRLVACIGFGVDAFHGVCNADYLEAVAELTRAGGFLGASSFLPDMPEVAAYRDAVEYVHSRMTPSIVNASIVDAIEGRFGDHHRTTRTRGSKLFINPLMALCWGFELAAVAARSLYLRELEGTRTIWDVQLIIEAFRHGVKTRERVAIPG